VKRTFLIATVFVTASVAAFGTPILLGTFGVSPNGTFLEQSSNDNCSFGTAVAGCTAAVFNPTFIDLTTLGAHAGDLLEIIPQGTICFLPGSGCTQYAASFGGVFDTSTTLLGPANLNRLPGAVSSGLPAIADTGTWTWFGSVNTSIPQDFQIATGGLFVTMPDARYLVVGSLDSFYADNTGNGLAVQVLDIGSPGPAVVGAPEPAAYAMMFAGLAGLAGLRKKLRR
jgi:hypothetical protein